MGSDVRATGGGGELDVPPLEKLCTYPEMQSEIAYTSSSSPLASVLCTSGNKLSQAQLSLLNAVPKFAVKCEPQGIQSSFTSNSALAAQL